MIEDFKQAISEVWQGDGKNTWPIDLNAVTDLFMDLFVEELVADYTQLERQGANDSTFSALLQTHARIIRLIMPCVQGLKKQGAPIAEIQETVNWLLSLAKHLKHGDLCGRDEKNIILAPDKVNRSIDGSRLIAADPTNSLVILKLCGILWAYAEVVFFKTHGLFREFHGPYAIDGFDQEFVIRDFVCLNPVELWPECQAVKYRHLRVITAYEQLEPKIDIYNNLYIKPGKSYLKGLRYFYIEGDGQILSLGDITELNHTLSKVITSIGSQIDTLHWRDLAKHYAMIFWFSKKAIRDALNIEWQYPQTVRERIETGELNTRFQKLSQKDLQRLLRLSF